MLRNYLLTATRNLFRNPSFSIINITGLVVGLASSMLIGLWVIDELTWDSKHVNRDRIARVYINGLGDGNEIYTQMAVCLPLWDAFKTQEPDILRVSPTNWGWEITMGVGEKRINKFTHFVGEDFLKMFTFPLVRGTDDLSNPNAMVITESAARELFGDVDPIGKTILVNNHFEQTVTGIIQDPPTNSSFQFKCLIPFESYIAHDDGVKRAMTNWSSNGWNMYVEFRPGADPVAVEQRVKDLIKKNSTEGGTEEVTFLGMNRWRLWAEFENGKSVGGRITYVRSFSLIGVFILIIACINFTNLATARSEKRAKEVGVRKSIGSTRKDLILQFLGETTLLALISCFLAVALVQLILPLFNLMIGKNLSIDFTNIIVWLSIPCVALLTGVLAGSYPAFYLSSFKPARVLKGNGSGGKGGALPRKILVTVQFFLSIALTIATIATYLQINHMRARSLGYDSSNLLLVYAGDKNQPFKHELLRSGLASSVATSSSPVTSMYSFNSDIAWEGKRDDQRNGFAIIHTGYDYSTTLNVNVIEGRDFDPTFNDSTSILLNRSAVEYMGLNNPVGTSIGTFIGERTVVGVLEDMLMSTPTENASPTVFFFNDRTPREMMIRMATDRPVADVIAGIEKIYKQHLPDNVFDPRFTDLVFSRRFASFELIGSLTNLFSVLAILISCLGLFGLASFTAERRTKEIGIRKVLGASVTSLVSLLSKEFSVLVLIAFTLAAPLTIWQANSILGQYAYHATVSWWVGLATGFAALVLTLTTVGLHAFRAARNNPTKALRTE